MKLGKYVHYKRKEYQVIAVGRDSETLAEVVIYKALYDSPEFGDGAIWVRKKEEFLSEIVYNGKLQPRFSYIGKE